jgi:hypothetical protein
MTGRKTSWDPSQGPVYIPGRVDIQYRYDGGRGTYRAPHNEIIDFLVNRGSEPVTDKNVRSS